MYGTYETIDGTPAVRFERVYPHAVERVWRMITVPEEMAAWFPSTVEVDLREGGEMAFTFPEHDGRADDGPRARARPAARVRVPVGRGRAAPRARARRRRAPADAHPGAPSADEAARNAAGWHVCLDRLGGEETDWEPLLRGVPAARAAGGRGDPGPQR